MRTEAFLRNPLLIAVKVYWEALLTDDKEIRQGNDLVDAGWVETFRLAYT